ncbi:cystathionine beta-lyase [Ketogulonicigenium robustum]|uniref:Cystathionine beta-lyase n=1 Tax=Ketogulonicigenium robustum TaxID=92947 RepID=A0A1W6NWK9_9RHOB|nr:cystathionine beta-lyase [Ketogulonicigenium robustum]ARO13417.1 cystathionine beta-lyase [Ketogulonicigenium robustum]
MSKPDGTLLVNTGRPHGAGIHGVNPPIVRASTFVFDTLTAFEDASKTPFDVPFYGRVGTPTTFAFEAAMAELEGGHRAIATSSGVSAISAVLLGFMADGGHLLVVDTVYEPVRRFCTRMLARMGVETTFYDPAIGAEIADLIRDDTRLIYMESPGSGTFDVLDVPAIVAAAKARAVPTAIDNTWATPLFFRPLEHGVDVSIHAATKYIVGHSDAMLGVITTNAAVHDAVRRATQDLGACAGIEEVNLGLRGLRTLDVRLRRHAASAMQLAQWLQAQPGVARVLHPALPDCPGHAFWARDFDGAAGLFSVELTGGADAARQFIDALQLFRIGFSWGGFESLVLPVHLENRALPRWANTGALVRLQVGLEDPDDLQRDLAQALAVIAP